MNFDGYKPHKMHETIVALEKCYSTFRMVPPGNMSYFYSIGNMDNMTDDQRRQLRTITDEANPVLMNDSRVLQAEQNMLNVPRLNYIDGDLDVLRSAITVDDLKEWKAQPRPEPIIEEEEERPKSPWNFSKSLFASRPQDTDELMHECFDYDWNCSKIEKILKNTPKD